MNRTLLTPATAVFLLASVCNQHGASLLVGEMEFIEFGPAEFVTGCPTNVPNEWKADVTLYPAKPERVGRFWFGKYPVTVKEYCNFLNAVGYKPSYTANRRLFYLIEERHGEFAPKKGKESYAIGG